MSLGKSWILRSISISISILMFYALVASPARADSAPSFLPGYCTRVETGRTDESLIDRHHHCQKADPIGFTLHTKTQIEGGGTDYPTTGEGSLEAYTYTELPADESIVTLRFKALYRTVSGTGDRVYVRARVKCTKGCTTSDEVMTTPMALTEGIASDAISVSFTPEYALSADPDGVSGAKEAVPNFAIAFDTLTQDLDAGPVSGGNTDAGYVPTLRCDQNLVRRNSEGCVYSVYPPIMTSLIGDANVAEAAQHIRNNQAATGQGKFAFAEGSHVMPDRSVGTPLTRIRDAQLRNANRAASLRKCGSIAAVKNLCLISGDEDDAQQEGTGPCDCDEYPFASTYEGAENNSANSTVDYIEPKDNRSAGGRLGAFFYSERVAGKDEFWVDPGQ